MSGFADDLNQAMEKAGITAAQLAQRSGLTESAISYLRAGRREPSYATMKALTQALYHADFNAHFPQCFAQTGE